MTEEILKQSIDNIGEVIDKLLDEVEAARTLGHGPQSTFAHKRAMMVTKLIKVNRDLLKDLDFGDRLEMKKKLSVH